MPNGITVHGRRITPEDKLVGGASALEYAKARGIIDVWTEVVVVYFGNTHSLKYEGTDATKIWKAWQGIVYGQKKTHKVSKKACRNRKA